MAFMGLMVVGIILMAFVGVVILTVITLIIGLVTKKKHKNLSKIMFILSGVGGTIIAVVLLLILIPKPEIIETPTGEVKIRQSKINAYKEYLSERNLDGMRELLDEYPEIVYYQDVNRVTLLDYGMYHTDIEMMKLAMEYGAVFDDPLTYEHLTFANSFDSFFQRLDYPNQGDEGFHKQGVVTEDILETVEFMIEHGADLEYDGISNQIYDNFYEEASDWVSEDYVMDELDSRLLELIEENMKR